MADSEIEPHQAGSDLDAVEASRRQAVRLAAGAVTTDRRYFAVLGVLMGSLGLAVDLTMRTHPWVWITGLFVYVGVLQVAVYQHQRSKRATARGWTSRISWALGTTIALYTLGVVGAATGLFPATLAIWLPYAVLTAAPMLVAAVVRGRAR